MNRPIPEPPPRTGPTDTGPARANRPIRLGGALHHYGKDINRLQRLLDPFMVAGLFTLIVRTRGESLPTGLLFPPELWILLLTSLLLPSGKLYQSYRQQSLWTLLRRISLSWLMVLNGLLVVAFAAKQSADFSRLGVGLWALLSWLLLIGLHIGGRKLLRSQRSRGGNKRTVIFWGSPESAGNFYKQLQDLPYLGLELLAWFQPPRTRPAIMPPQMPACAGGLDDLRRWLNVNDVDQIYFSYTSDEQLPMQEVIRFFGDTCKPVFYLPPWAQTSMRFNVEQMGSSFCISLWEQDDSMIDRQLKRLLDLLLAGSAVILLSPLLLVVALLISLTSPGPILFCQDRYGLDGHRFKIYKFRTMRVTESGDTPGLKQAQRDDPRITPIGRLLRRWSIDELPQLLNVLNGSMSLVGPRPHAVDHNELYRRLIPGYMQRHLFKPGMTGLAQVEGWRGETAELEAMSRRVEADLRYQREWSLNLDIKILLRTILHLRSPNAY